MLKLLFSIMIIIPMLLNAQFSLVSPFGGEYFQKNTGTQIKWETSFVGSIDISFSSDGGSNWSIIGSSINANLGIYDWSVPDLNSTTCKIKISTVPDNGNPISSYNFTIGDEAILPRILVDEKFEDWDIFPDIGQIFSDVGVENTLKVINDNDILYIYFETDEILSLQNNSSLILYIDSDNDSLTGKVVNGIGAEIEFRFGERNGTVYLNNNEYSIGVKDLFLILSPTVWSDKYEITMNLNSTIDGINLFSDERIRLLIKNESAGTATPSVYGGSGYSIGDYSFAPLQTYSMVKQSNEHLRIMSHNVLFSNFMKEEATESYKRLYRTIQPDIIGFSELYEEYSIDQIKVRLEEILPSEPNESWNVERTNDNVLATRFNIKYNNSAGPFGNGVFWVDLRPTYDSDLLIVVAHPPCCANDEARQHEVDAIAAFIRDAKNSGGEITLADKTPILIVGDMNFVGDPQQISTLLDGDIVQEDIYGNDFIQDWDGTSLEDTNPLISNLPHTFTQLGHGGPGSYSNGKLDYIMYSGSVLNLENSFVMYTPAMQPNTLATYGLQENDTDIASDHLPLIADFSLSFEQQENDISSIRENDENGEPVLIGQTFTIKGVVTSSNQFGNNGPASMQDNSAGISVYGAEFANVVNIGDSVVITASLTQYRGLTQFTATTPVILSSGNEVEPEIVTLSQVANQDWTGVELYESKLVRINGVTITGSGTFESGINYPITDATGTLDLRIDNDVSTLIGSPIPSGEIDLIGVVGQFKYAAPYNSGYQIIPRNINDLISDDVPIILTPVIGTNVTINSFTVFFNTVRNGNSEIQYGKTETLELGSIISDTDTTEHQIELIGLEEYTKYYYKAFSTNDVGTSESSLKSILTLSSNPQTGTINIYFNKDVDTSVAISGNAANGNVDFQEKILSRINETQYSMDIALYSFFGLPDVEQAIVAAKNRGVKVRFVYDQRTMQSGAQALLDAGILMSQKPDNTGIMHNKFAIFDARDGNPANDWLWLGSWNWTSTELNWQNNVIEINDLSLAVNYTTEFEEMWGSDTDTPDSANAKFGKYKTDNTTHSFTIDGIEIESYFSPSDQTESHIVNSILTADTSVYFALLAFTSDPISEAIQARHNNYFMNDGRGLISDANNQGSEFENLLKVFPNEILDHDGGEKLHHKFGIVDASNISSNPQVITGSHNWSRSANEKNDENTLIFHDLYIANQFMQAFKALYNATGGTTDFVVPVFTSVTSDGTLPTEFVLEQNYPNPFNPSTTIKYSIPVEIAHGMSSQMLTLKVYDILGREVAILVNEVQSPGNYSVKFNASELTSGMYFYKLQFGASVQTRKMLLIK